MANLSDEKLNEVHSAINIFNKTGDDTLPIGNLIDCLRSLGLNPLKSEVSKIARDFHAEKRGKTGLTVEEFLPIYDYFSRRRKPTFEELCEGLKSLNSTDGGW